MKLVITGADGFLGWHLRCYFFSHAEIDVVSLGRDDFADISKREAAVASADAIVHLAGMNRGDDQELYETNKRLMEELLAACETTQAKPHIIFSSSTHVARDTAYGKSKREAGERLLAWAAAQGTPACVLILPNIFGEDAQPQYNSAVATFCYDLATGKESVVNVAAAVTLIHAQDVARLIHEAISARAAGEQRVAGTDTTIGTVHAKLKDFFEQYSHDLFPLLATPFDLALFNTLRSALYAHGFYPRPLAARSDDRGQLFEAVKQRGGGQMFFSHTKLGFTRGNHYHGRKIERFCVIAGTGEIAIRKLFSDTVDRFVVSGDAPVFIDMPTFYSHTVTNTGTEDLITLFWCNEIGRASCRERV